MAQPTPKVKQQPHPTAATGYTRCAGCFSWTNSYSINQTDDGWGFALCKDCQHPCDEWQFDDVLNNIRSYTGGDIFTL